MRCDDQVEIGLDVTAGLPEQVGATTEGSDAVRVRVRIAFDNGRQAASEVVVLMGADEDPLRTADLSWIECNGSRGGSGASR